MNDRDRLAQLRGVLDRLERMPASAERDWMLGEVRARAVDVETGVMPAAVRALPHDEADAEHASHVAAKEPRARRKPSRKQPSRRPPGQGARGAARGTLASPTPRPSLVAARERAGHENAVDLLEQGGVLCLDDPPAVAAGASRPWAVGLRG